MPRVTWRGLGAVVVLLSLGLATGNAQAAEAGPQLAFLRWGGRPPVLEVQTSDGGGGTAERLVGGGVHGQPPIPHPFSPISWSGDGSLVAFGGLTGKVSLGPGGGKIFVVPADGGKPRPVSGTVGGQFPVFAPDGRSLAFVRVRGNNSSWSTSGGKHGQTFARTSIWLAQIDGGPPQMLTPWRKQAREWPSSFSPDGATLAITQQPDGVRSSRTVALAMNGGGRSVIAEDAAQAVFSPDGSRVAMLRIGARGYRHDSKGGRGAAGIESTSDLIVANNDGSDLTQLTRTRAIEESPSWDPSGRRLAFVRLARPLTERAVFGLGDTVMEVNADGTCPTKVLSAPGVAFLSPVWQPGPGREAGPIAC
jgi:Tol biopolymer transport system component